MTSYHELVEWGAAIAGVVLVAVSAGAWLYRGSLSWMDVVVALIGTASFAVAVQDFVCRRGRDYEALRGAA